MVRILVLAHNFRSEDQKKSLKRCEILGFVFVVQERDFTHARGAQTVFWGAQAPKYSPVAQGFLSGHNPRLGGKFLA